MNQPVIAADQALPFVTAMYSGIGELRLFDHQTLSPSVLREADALLVRSGTTVDAALLRGSKVRFVGTATVGHDHVDIACLERMGIAFASAPGSNANSVSEYVIAALLEVADRKQVRLAGRTVGVVGVGNVGRQVVKKAETLGMRALCNDPPLQRATRDRTFVPLDDIEDADIVSLHVPLTRSGPDPTFHLFDRVRLSRLKPGCILVNTARGAVVEGEALKDALRTGRIGAAVVDVWEGEPNIDPELLDLVAIGTPHIAGHSIDGKVAAATMIYQALARHFSLPIKWTAQGSIPPPAVAEISSDGGNGESSIRDIVRAAYDLRNDDELLRSIRTEPGLDRARYFANLRETYPDRREFPAFTVALSSAPPRVRRALAGLGFNVRS